MNVDARQTPTGHLELMVDGMVFDVGRVRGRDGLDRSKTILRKCLEQLGEYQDETSQRLQAMLQDAIDELSAGTVERLVSTADDALSRCEKAIEDCEARVKQLEDSTGKTVDRTLGRSIRETRSDLSRSVNQDVAKEIDKLRAQMKEAHAEVREMKAARKQAEALAVSLPKRIDKEVAAARKDLDTAAVAASKEISGTASAAHAGFAQRLESETRAKVDRALAKIPPADKLRGEPGQPGPIPRYEYDETQTRIRFEAKRAKNGSVAKWGEWVYLGSKIVRRQGAIASGHGTVLSERDIIGLIERYAGVPALEGYTQVHEDLPGTTDYLGYNKPNSGQWYIRKIDHSTDPIQHTFATLDSTGGVDYATAWAGRAGLTYKTLQQVVL